MKTQKMNTHESKEREFGERKTASSYNIYKVAGRV